MMQRSTEAQPTKIAELYRFVTGGRPCRYMRTTRPAVWIRNAPMSSMKAILLNVFGQSSQENSANTRTIRYSAIAWRKGRA